MLSAFTSAQPVAGEDAQPRHRQVGKYHPVIGAIGTWTPSRRVILAVGTLDMTHDEHKIRQASQADCAAVVACVRAAYVKYVGRIGGEPAPMLADYPTLIARGVVYVLPDGLSGDLRGLIVVWPKDGAMFVENVAVDPSYQREGLGCRLMAFAEELARAAGLPDLRLHTNEAMTENLAFYGRLGFEEISRSVQDGYRRVFLRKILM